MLTQWEKIKAAERMQAHIEANLKERITMAELARVARYSPWHASRVFKEITGKSPFEYIRLRRLSMAAQTLRQSSRKVVDVAFDFVFDSHEGFSRAFAKEFGLPPLRFRRADTPLDLFMPPRLRDWYIRRQKGDAELTDQAQLQPLFVQVLDRPARKMILKRGIAASHYYDYCEEVGCEVWDTLAGIKDAIHEPMGLWLPPNMKPEGTSEYVQGVEVPLNYSGELPAGFDLIELQPVKMMVFQGPSFEDKDFEAAISAVWSAIKAYDPKLYGFEWADEEAPRFQLRPEGSRGYIEGKPVRPL